MEKRLTELAPGQTLTIIATDPMAKIDIPLFCRQHGHALSIVQQGDATHFVVVKA
ncbi:sulfurtransferase TusA family protein [Devosia algicola]|uniref:Sulfurtransferase TusA family protein n=1 Tax=Devosia algicola TaxID=3026418 RepID=A0ABY7YT63_9HYPH|nr:sulfurtransferase TusA family protein [Devosia algicola]WDR04303.1 sulfurtransferase TusA family protein [Devosia algicola]